MALVLVAHTHCDLQESSTRYLIKGLGAVVEPVNVEVRVCSPDLVQLGDGAAAHCYSVQQRILYLVEGVRFGIESPDRGMGIEAKNLVSASGNTGESTFNLLEMLG